MAGAPVDHCHHDVYAHLFPSLNQDLADQLDGVFRRAAGAHEAAATEPETE